MSTYLNINNKYCQINTTHAMTHTLRVQLMRSPCAVTLNTHHTYDAVRQHTRKRICACVCVSMNRASSIASLGKRFCAHHICWDVGPWRGTLVSCISTCARTTSRIHTLIFAFILESRVGFFFRWRVWCRVCFVFSAICWVCAQYTWNTDFEWIFG